MAAIIDGVFDSTTVIRIILQVGAMEITQTLLPFFLRTSPSTVEGLLYGNRNTTPPTPRWPRPKDWKGNLDAVKSREKYEEKGGKIDHNQLLNPEERERFFKENRIFRLQKFLASPVYENPESFENLLEELLTECFSCFKASPREAISTIIACLDKEHIDPKYKEEIKTMKRASFRELAKKLVEWGKEGSTKKKKSEEAPLPKAKYEDWRLQRFMDLIGENGTHGATEEGYFKDLSVLDEVLAFLWEHRRYLCHALPKINPSDEGYVPAARCVFGDQPGEEPLLYADYLQEWIDEVIALFTDHPNAKEREFLLNRALTRADRVIVCADTHEVSEKAMINAKTLNSTDSLRSSAYLSKVMIYCLMAKGSELTDAEDIAQCCMRPAVDALRAAVVLPCENKVIIRERIKALRETFFRPDSAMHILFGEEFSELSADYNRMVARMEQYMENQSSHSVYAVPEELMPVFSSVYDSVAGRLPGTRENMELLTFQLVATGRTPLLQLPQVVDNRNFLLLLLNEEDFRLLCKQGIIALSAFTANINGERMPILEPKQYLIACLENEKFHFSASGWYEHEDAAFRKECRSTMARAIREGLPFRAVRMNFPSEAREEMKLLYEGYRIVGEVFPKSYIKKYHQDPACRSTARSWATYAPVALPQLIDRRLQELQDDELNHCVEGRSRLLVDFYNFQRRAKAAGCMTRSDYESQIARWMAQEEVDVQSVLLFRKIVDYAYNVSNGRRCCDTIFSHQSDDLLRIHPTLPGEVTKLSDGALAVKYVFDEYKSKKRSSAACLTAGDLGRLSLEIRRLLSDKSIRDQQFVQQMERLSGVGYHAVDERSVIVSDMNIVTSQGQVINSSLQQQEGSQSKGVEVNG